MMMNIPHMEMFCKELTVTKKNKDIEDDYGDVYIYSPPVEAA